MLLRSAKPLMRLSRRLRFGSAAPCWTPTFSAPSTRMKHRAMVSPATNDVARHQTINQGAQMRMNRFSCFFHPRTLELVGGGGQQNHNKILVLQNPLGVRNRRELI